MQMLEAVNIKKFFGDRQILGFDELKVYEGDKIGIVGQNGSGKTTLMNILAGELAPDEGFVRQFCESGYIRQFSEEEMEADRRLLKEFNLSHKNDRTHFSGGEYTRIKITNAINAGRMLLFADEPTANLDYRGTELLRQKLFSVETLLLISHDRELLDSLCNRILEVRDGKIRLYEGNYSDYRLYKGKEQERAELEYEKYMAEKANLEAAITDRRNRVKAMKKTPTRMGNSEARLHKRETMDRQQKVNNAVNSMKTRLEKLEVKDKPKELPGISLDFSMTHPPENKIVISVEGLHFSYGENIIFENTGFKAYNGCKTVLWGENGTGKSTLLNLLADPGFGNGNDAGIGGPRSNSIYIVPKAKIGYFRQGFENLDYERTVLENVMADSVQNQTVVRTILARLLISGDDVYKKVGLLSGGERIKVSFAKLFVSDANVLLLDEPTNYLDMMSVEALEQVLQEYEGTVLLVSHDKSFVHAVADRLLIFKDRSITEFEGSLKEYEATLLKKKAEISQRGKGRKGNKGDSNTEIKALSDTERMILQMRMTEIVAKMSRSDGNREALEEEYQKLVLQLR